MEYPQTLSAIIRRGRGWRNVNTVSVHPTGMAGKSNEGSSLRKTNQNVLEPFSLFLEVDAGSELSLVAAEKLNDDITSRRSAADAAKPSTLQIYAQHPLQFLLITCNQKSFMTAQGKKKGKKIWINSRYEIN